MTDYEKTLIDTIDLDETQDNHLQELLLKVREQNQNGDYEQMAITLETCVKIEPDNGKLVLLLARACRDSGKKIQAVRWFRKLISEFGMVEAEQELMELYKSGIAGEEYKTKAEEYFAEIEKAKKAEATEEDNEKFFQEFAPKKEVYSEKLLEKMEALLEYEENYYIDRMKQLEPEHVPEKRGFIFTNKREIERIEKENANKAAEKKALEEKYQSMLKELEEEKKACGIKSKLFFEYPIVRKHIRTFFSSLRYGSKGYSLYGFGNNKLQEFYLNHQGYAGNYSFVEDTLFTGELNFEIFDQKQNMKLVDKEYPRGENECLYLVGNIGSRVGGFDFVKRMLKDERLIHLYCDWNYLKEHSSEKMSVRYLWDREYRFCPSNSNCKTLVENLATYHMCEHNLTDVLYNIKEGNAYSNIRDVFVKDAKIWENQCFQGSIGEYDFGEYRYKKKALIMSHEYDGGRKIVAILVPREAADVVVIKGDYVKHPDPSCTEGYVLRVNAIEREEGVCWKYYVGTTIHHSARTFLKNIPLDLTEEKPEGLPDDLWRFWFRQRYYFTHQK